MTGRPNRGRACWGLHGVVQPVADDFGVVTHYSPLEGVQAQLGCSAPSLVLGLDQLDVTGRRRLPDDAAPGREGLGAFQRRCQAAAAASILSATSSA